MIIMQFENSYIEIELFSPLSKVKDLLEVSEVLLEELSDSQLRILQTES
jgi:hypothetical protein